MQGRDVVLRVTRDTSHVDAWAIALTLFLFSAAACFADATDDTPRVVTYAPAITQMLIDLDMGDAIVGVSEFDTAQSDARPNVGNYIDPNTERLLSLRPTHVLMMSTQGGLPPRLEELADRGVFTLKSYAYPKTAVEVGDVLIELGNDFGLADQATRTRDRMREQLDEVRRQTAGFDRPRVLIAFGTGPVWASGPGTVNDALLEAVNADNAAANAATSAVTYDREALLRDAPDVILLLLPGAPPLEANDPRLAEFAGLPIPAVENHRIHLIADPLVLLPATHLPRITEQMARAIHPGYDSQDDEPDQREPEN